MVIPILELLDTRAPFHGKSNIWEKIGFWSHRRSRRSRRLIAGESLVNSQKVDSLYLRPCVWCGWSPFIADKLDSLCSDAGQWFDNWIVSSQTRLGVWLLNSILCNDGNYSRMGVWFIDGVPGLWNTRWIEILYFNPNQYGLYSRLNRVTNHFNSVPVSTQQVGFMNIWIITKYIIIGMGTLRWQGHSCEI